MWNRFVTWKCAVQCVFGRVQMYSTQQPLSLGQIPSGISAEVGAIAPGSAQLPAGYYSHLPQQYAPSSKSVTFTTLEFISGYFGKMRIVGKVGLMWRKCRDICKMVTVCHMHVQCDLGAIDRITSDARHHCSLVNSKLYSSLTVVCVWTACPRVITWNGTRNLLGPDFQKNLRKNLGKT